MKELFDFINSLRGKQPSAYVLLGGSCIVVEILFFSLLALLIHPIIAIGLLVVVALITGVFFAALADERPD